MTSVWLFKPRSHGRKREATRARNGAPLPGRTPSVCSSGDVILPRTNPRGPVRCLYCPSAPLIHLPELELANSDLLEEFEDTALARFLLLLLD